MILEPGRVDTLLHVHEDVVDAIATREPEQAERVMRAHLENVVITLKARVASFTA